MLTNSKTLDDSTDSIETPESVWPAFKEWLAGNGVKPNTSETYCVQVRRLLREVDPLTSEGLEQWGQKITARLRTPFRSSWRRYRQFTLFQFGVNLPDFPSSKTDSEDTTPALCRALALCVQSGLTPSQLESLTTTIERGVRWRALAEINKKVANDQVYVVTTDAGALALVPSDAYNVLREWGGETTRLSPSRPGASTPMLAAKIGRLSKE
jgi:hypothetical protein